MFENDPRLAAQPAAGLLPLPSPATPPQPATAPATLGLPAGLGPIAAAPPQVKLRRTDDATALRQSVYDSVLNAASQMEPITGPTHTLRAVDVHYAKDDPEFDRAAEKRARLERTSLNRRLRGTWQLLDNATGDVVSERKATMANVPAVLQDGSIMHRGTKYMMGYQQRLRPGVYVRRRNNGELESHVNAKPGHGRSHRYVLTPETGLFHINVEHAKIPLVPLLEVLGASRDDMRAAWGEELAEQNFKKIDPKSVSKLYDRLVPKKLRDEDDRADPARMKDKIREAFADMKVDPAVVRRTLGREADTIDADMILRATAKTLRVQKHQEEQDDRDHLAYATFHSAPDIFSERFTKDYGRLRSELLRKAVRRGDLGSVPSAALDKQIDAAIFKSGIANTTEEINPLALLTEMTRVTRYGEGGLPSVTATPKESRNVNPGQFGFIDIATTPESTKIGVDGFLAKNTYVGDDNQLYTDVIDAKTGEKVQRSAADVLDATLEFAGSPIPGRAMAIRKGKMSFIKQGSGDYMLPDFEELFSHAANITPMKSSMFAQRGSMASRMSITGESNILVRRDGGGGYFGPIADYEWQDGDTSLSIDKTTHQMCWKPIRAKVTHRNDRRLFRVITKSGRSFVATEDHSCVTLDDFGNLKKIKTQDYKKYWPIPCGPVFSADADYTLPWVVPAGNKHNAYPSVSFELTKDLGWIIGLYLAEGYGNYRKVRSEGPESVTFANINLQIQERSKAFFEAHGVSASIATGRPDKQDDRIVTHWRQLAIKLKEDFGDGAYNKKLPGWVVFSPKEFREGLVAGYIDGDGSVAKAKDRSLSVGGSSRSRILRDGLCAVLGSLGIATTQTAAWVDTGPGGSRVQQFLFNVRKEHIGFLPECTYPLKRAKVEAAEWSGTRSGDWLPMFAAARCLYRRFTKRGTAAYRRADQHHLGNLSRAEIIEVFGENVNWITHGWASSQVWWERVISVKEVTEQHKYVYDLDLADNVFWVDGVFVHNSGQSLSLENPEAPWVQTGVQGQPGVSHDDLLGERLGAVRSPGNGRVMEVTPEYMAVKYAGGEVKRFSLDNNRPGARKSLFHNTPLVKVGDDVAEGQLLAKSNYTDDNGTAAMGRNLRVGLMSLEDNWEDGFVISESASKALEVQQAYTHGIESGEGKEVDKQRFLQTFGGTYEPEQLKVIDDDGAVQVGTTVKKGDPLLLAWRERDGTTDRVHQKGRSNFIDSSVTWDHNHGGVVTDVVKSPKGVQVVVKTSQALQVGSKISGRAGNKGVVDIWPDDQMPHDADGNPIDIAISPQAVPSRGNSSFPIELVLGKIAKQRGEAYKIVDGEHPDMAAFAAEEAKKYGVEQTETLIDPRTGRKIPGILTGQMFTMALHHQAESKQSSRGLGSYTAEGQPARGKAEGAGAKRFSGQQLYSSLSHGAYDYAREGSLLRGKRNDDYWSAFMSGDNIGEPRVSEQYEAFVDRLKGAGINPVKRGSKTQLMAMTDKDIDKLAGGRVVTSAETFDNAKRRKEISGGLFDPKLFGEGDKFALIELPEAMPNPVFEEPLRRLLGLTERQFRDTLAGTRDLSDYGSGPEAIAKRLRSMDLDQELKKAREEIKGTRKVARDAAVRRMTFLKGLQRTGVQPADLMVTKIPVVPPRLRPITEMQGKGGLMVNDANFLYRELMHAGENLKGLKDQVDDVSEERLALYDSHKALVGLSESRNQELRQRKVAGLLKSVLGKNSPKSGMMQRKLLSGNVDTVGRGVIMVDSNLDMDTIGLPESMAFNIFQPYIVRSLVSGGVPKATAMEYAKEKHPRAREALLQVMKERPVTASRAPILHKYGDLGQWATLVKGDAIRYNPHITSPQGADYDGDTVNIHVPHSQRAVREVVDRMMPSKMLHDIKDFRSAVFRPSQDMLLGLHEAARPADKNKRLRIFASKAEMLAAFRRGEIDVDTPVRFPGS